MGVSRSYKSSFDRITEIKGKRIELSLEEPTRIPELVVRNNIQNDYPSIYISKTGIVVNRAIVISTNGLSPVETIHLRGPQLFGETEFVNSSPYLYRPLGGNWEEDTEEALNGSIIGLNIDKVKDLIEHYKEIPEVREIAQITYEMSEKDLISIAHENVLNRKEPSGSTNIVGHEAFEQVVTNSLVRNFTRCFSLLRRDKFRPILNGKMNIDKLEVPLRGEDGRYRTCLKIGPCNKLLTLRAVYLLNSNNMVANPRNVTMLLSSHMLVLAARIKKLKDSWKNPKMYSEKISRYKSGITVGFTKIQSHYYGKLVDERDLLDEIQGLELKFEKDGIVKDALYNTRKSIESLLNDGALGKKKGKYYITGLEAETPYGTVKLDKSEDSLALEKIRLYYKMYIKRETPQAPAVHQYRENLDLMKTQLHQLYEEVQKISDANSKGHALQNLFEMLLNLSNLGLVVVHRNLRGFSYEVDLFIENGSKDPFLSGLGHDIIIECKNWGKPVDASTIRNLRGIMENINVQTCILVTKNGITGTVYDARFEIMLAWSRGIKIIVITNNDLRALVEGKMTLYEVIRKGYHNVLNKNLPNS